MLDQDQLNNRLYSTFVLLQMIDQIAMITGTEVKVHHDKFSTITEKIVDNIDIALHLEIDIIMTKSLLLYIIHFPDMTTTVEILDLTVILTDLHLDRSQNLTHPICITIAKLPNKT